MSELAAYNKAIQRIIRVLQDLELDLEELEYESEEEKSSDPFPVYKSMMTLNKDGTEPDMV